MTRATDDGWEDGSGGVISGETSLHHAGTVIAHQGGGLFVVPHVEWVPEIEAHDEE